LGVEARGFVLEQGQATGFSAHGNAGGSLLFAIPFFDLNTNTETAALINAFDRRGSLAVTSSSRLWGTEGAGLVGAYSGDGLSLQCLAGIRCAGLEEGEDLVASRASVNPGVLLPFLGTGYGPGNTTTTVDYFHTRSEFYGGQLGARAAYAAGRLSGQIEARIALGATHSQIAVDGLTALTTAGGAVTTAPGGLFTGPSRLGQFCRDDFSVLPEVEARLACQLSDRLALSAGYHFLCWTSVVRPGDQVNRNVDKREIPVSDTFDPSARVAPEPPAFRSAGFWAQGITFGLEFRY
jgi:hypothetical protein